MPNSLEAIRRGIEHYRKQGNASRVKLDENTRFDTWEALKAACDSEAAAYVVLTWAFPDAQEDLPEPTVVVPSDLGHPEWLALNRFVAPKRLPGGKYGFRPGLDEECAMIWYEQQHATGDLVETENDGHFTPSGLPSE